jgi:transcriptional regulator with XRE-family HTH domain
MGIAEQLQNAIRDAGESRYSISKRTGISQAMLSRVLSGERGMRLEMIDRLMDGLGLEIVIRPRRKPRKDG